MNNFFNSEELTFGSDPETFAAYTKNGINYVEPPVHFRTKLKVPYKPDPKHPVFFEKDGIVILEDGVAFEYTLPPVKYPNNLYTEIQQANYILSNFLMEHGYIKLTIPAISYEIEKFINDGERYKLCLIFGCDPDKDAIVEDYSCKITSSFQQLMKPGIHNKKIT